MIYFRMSAVELSSQTLPLTLRDSCNREINFFSTILNLQLPTETCSNYPHTLSTCTPVFMNTTKLPSDARYNLIISQSTPYPLLAFPLMHPVHTNQTSPLCPQIHGHCSTLDCSFCLLCTFNPHRCLTPGLQIPSCPSCRKEFVKTI